MNYWTNIILFFVILGPYCIKSFSYCPPNGQKDELFNLNFTFCFVFIATLFVVKALLAKKKFQGFAIVGVSEVIWFYSLLVQYPND